MRSDDLDEVNTGKDVILWCPLICRNFFYGTLKVSTAYLYIPMSIGRFLSPCIINRYLGSISIF
jgi:hypothetical protein